MASYVNSFLKAALTLLAASGQTRERRDDGTSLSVADEVASLHESGSVSLQPAIEIGGPNYANVDEAAPCVLQLASHEFGFSYGSPFVANFSAPVWCSEDHSVVYLKWAASSPLGVQYDRIAAVWVNGVELLRTSTEEPSRRGGVSWQVVKEISPYYDVLKSGGIVVVALDNVISGPYNSSFTIDLTAEFYKPLDPELSHTPRKPDRIVPVSTSTRSYGWFNVQPNSLGTNGAMVSVPANTEELYLELFLSHHQCDEFFYTNPPSDFAQPLLLCGNGPFREIQVLVDDTLVGVVWPFPLVFTGGFNPYMWRPIVSIGAFNAPTYLLNLTPFLDLFTDAQPHNVTFAVDFGLDFWPIDGNLLIYQDPNGHQTQATVLERTMLRHVEPATTQHVDGLNGSFLVQAERDVLVQTRVTTSSGSKIYTLTQRFDFTNQLTFTDDGNRESFAAYTRVHTRMRVSQDSSSGQLATTLTLVEEYPISGESLYEPRADGSFYLEAALINARSWALDVESSSLAEQRSVSFRPAFAPSETHAVLQSSGVMDSRVGGNGTTQASYRSTHGDGVCFARHVAAQYDDLTMDVNTTAACGRQEQLEAY